MTSLDVIGCDDLCNYMTKANRYRATGYIRLASVCLAFASAAPAAPESGMQRSPEEAMLDGVHVSFLRLMKREASGRMGPHNTQDTLKW